MATSEKPWFYISKNNNSARAVLFYTFLCRHCMTTKQDVKVPSFTFYGGRNNKPESIFPFFLTWILWLWGTPEKFGYTKWVSWNNRDEDWNSANGLTAFAVLGKVSNDKWTIHTMKWRQNIETQVESLAPGSWFQLKVGKLKLVAKILETLYRIWA